MAGHVMVGPIGIALFQEHGAAAIHEDRAKGMAAGGRGPLGDREGEAQIADMVEIGQGRGA
jgi:hypothetical protein